jgi:SAM-dependent methyltransferase
MSGVTTRDGGSRNAYVLADAEFAAERDRLTVLAAASDPITVRELGEIGPRPGWHCLEVGAGNGSVARWLAGQVLPVGRVLATDLDTRFLTDLPALGIEVRRHDLVAEPLPPASFDLIHARFVVMHLGAAAESVVAGLAEALRPGGWLVVEDTDTVTHGLPIDDSDDSEFFARATAAHWRLLARAGVRVDIGRTLPTMLRGAGLADVFARGITETGVGGSALNSVFARTVESFRRTLVRTGFTDTDIDRYVRLLGDPDVHSFAPLVVVARGKRR